MGRRKRTENPSQPKLTARRSAIGILGIGGIAAAKGALSPHAAFAQGARYQASVPLFRINPSKPRPGQRATLLMNIATKGTGFRDVPWEIKVGKRIIGRGLKRRVKAGDRFAVTASWTATPGLHNFLGSADPKNTLREQGRERFDNARGFSLRVDATPPQTSSRGGSTSNRPPTNRGSTNTNRPPANRGGGTAGAVAYQVGVETFVLSPSKPKVGQRATVRMRVVAKGRGTRDVPWEIKVGGTVLRRGVQRQVRAGQKFDVSASWTAAAGLHNFLGSADPRNSFREQGRDRFDNARGFSVRVQAATAQTETRRGGNTRGGNQNQFGSNNEPKRFEVGVQTLTAAPVAMVKGQRALLTMVIKTGGDDDAKRDVEWAFKRENQIIKKGVKRNVRAGRSFSVKHSWNAPFGEFLVAGIADPDNKLGETGNRRSNNIKHVGLRKTNWAEWGLAALEGATQSIRLWQQQARFRNIRINGPTALGSPGCLTGPSIKPLIEARLLSKQCPPELADKIADAIADAFKAWQDGVTVPGLPWYPAFSAFPGPSAPPMPNVPMPLTALPSARLAEMEPTRLRQRITAAVGAASNDPGAPPAIQLVAARLGGRFAIFLASTNVQRVMGRGPVPTFAPPYVPVGPVVNGSVISAPGSLSSPPFPNSP